MQVEKTAVYNTNKSVLWRMLTLPQHTEAYMFGCKVMTTWEVGSNIRWEGTYMGHHQVLIGQVIEFMPENQLQYSNFDPNIGMEDHPKNYLNVSYKVEDTKKGTQLTITTSNIGGDKNRASEVAKGWDFVLDALEQYIEKDKARF